MWLNSIFGFSGETPAMIIQLRDGTNIEVRGEVSGEVSVDSNNNVTPVDSRSTLEKIGIMVFKILAAASCLYRTTQWISDPVFCLLMGHPALYAASFFCRTLVCVKIFNFSLNWIDEAVEEAHNLFDFWIKRNVVNV